MDAADDLIAAIEANFQRLEAVLALIVDPPLEIFKGDGAWLLRLATPLPGTGFFARLYSTADFAETGDVGMTTTTVTTTLSGSLTAGTGEEDITVASSSGFPTSGRFLVTVDSEQILVKEISGTTWTVDRGVNNTVGAAHSSGATVTFTLRSFGWKEQEPDPDFPGVWRDKTGGQSSVSDPTTSGARPAYPFPWGAVVDNLNADNDQAENGRVFWFFPPPDGSEAYWLFRAEPAASTTSPGIVTLGDQWLGNGLKTVGSLGVAWSGTAGGKALWAADGTGGGSWTITSTISSTTAVGLNVRVLGASYDPSAHTGLVAARNNKIVTLNSGYVGCVGAFVCGPSAGIDSTTPSATVEADGSIGAWESPAPDGSNDLHYIVTPVTPLGEGVATADDNASIGVAGGAGYKVSLTWSQVDQATGYRIYRSNLNGIGTGGNFFRVGEVFGGETLTYTDEGAGSATPYSSTDTSAGDATDGSLMQIGVDRVHWTGLLIRGGIVVDDAGMSDVPLTSPGEGLQRDPSDSNEVEMDPTTYAGANTSSSMWNQ